MTTLKADLQVRIGAHTVTASFAAQGGEVLAVVGPNGSGKTTLLRALAGLLPAAGSLTLDGVESLRLPPAARRIGWVPQAGVLLPRLTARDNVAYGPRARGVSKARARTQAEGWLERLGVLDLADRRPGELSGGQAQRVALARALATDPALMLLDEPLAALDATTRDDVRRLLRAVLVDGEAPALVVTHDPVDALALADRVLVLEDGVLVQDAPTAEVVLRPRSSWVAGLLWLNAWRGTATADGLAVDGGGHVTAAEPLPPGTEALALLAPAAVALHRTPPEGSPRTVFRGDVVETRTLGGRVRVVVASTPPVTAEVTVAAAAELDLADGGPVWATAKATEVRLVAR